MPKKKEEESAPKGKLAEVMQSVLKLDREKDKAEKKLEEVRGALHKESERLLRLLEAEDMDSVRAFGHLFTASEKQSVKVPKTPQEKKELFKFLRDKGIYWQSVSVHSQTLNSLYNSFAEEAANNGDLDFKMPGVEKPTPYKVLKLTKQKGKTK